MLTYKNRFHRRNHLNYVHKKGVSVRGQQISLRYVDGLDHVDYRAAVVVSRRVSKKAVLRNRIRRRIYEIVRTMNPTIRGDVDVIVSVFDDSVADMDFSQLTNQLKELLDKAGLRN
jgi:ribonuclease P protein component